MRLNPFRRRRERKPRRPGRMLFRRGFVALTDPFVELIDQSREPGRRWPLRLILVVTFAVFWIAFGTAEATYDQNETGLGSMFFVALLIVAPLLFVLTRPLPALLFSVASALALGLVLPVLDSSPWPWLVVQGLIVFVLLFATCVVRTLPEAAGAWLVTTLLFWWGTPSGQGSGWAAGLAAIALIGVLTGRLLRARSDLRAQTEVSESERARRVVLEERSRLARDLHDIVAHHMSLVVVQAETAQYRVPGLGEAARDELLSIAETARSALTETRVLLNVLRQENAEAENAPQPGLHLLDELVATSRRAGVDLETQITGDLAGLREGLSLAGFRIVQEALANASRHARGAPVRLEAHGDELGVDLAVVNGRPGSPPPTLSRTADGRLGWPEVGETPVGGHGIIGMRERAAAAGGRVQAGPTEQGFLVQVFLPGGQR